MYNIHKNLKAKQKKIKNSKRQNFKGKKENLQLQSRKIKKYIKDFTILIKKNYNRCDNF